MTQVTEPFPIFYDDDGTPLENGMIYVGQVNQDPRANPVVVYTDFARTIPIAQPIRTLNGRPAFQGAPINLYIAETEYSIAIQNRFGTPIVSAPDGSAFVTSRELAASGGSDLVGFIQSGAGAVARTVQDKLRETFTAEDFGAVGDGVTDDTAAIQSMLDELWGNTGIGGVGQLSPGKTYLVTSPLIVGSYVQFQLNGAKLLMGTSDAPVIEASKDALTQGWSVLGPGTIEYTVQQTSAQTDAVGIRIAKGGVFSFNFLVGGGATINVKKACTAVDSTPDSGSFAFVGTVDGVLANDCASWAFNFDCDTATGGITNLIIQNAWALQTDGAEQPDSKGFRFRGVQGLRAENLLADHIQNEWFFAESCYGSVGHLAFESCDAVRSTGQLSLIATINCKYFKFNTIYGFRNVLDISGTGEIYILRPDGGLCEYDSIEFKEFTFTDISSGSIFTINPTSGTRVTNEYFFQTDSLGNPVPENLADFGIVKLVERFDGNIRTQERGGRTLVSGTSEPATETWERGDTVWNTDTFGNGVFCWVCVTSGTPGVWLPVRLPAQGGAIPDATGGATIDAEARAAINALLAVARAQGVIAT